MRFARATEPARPAGKVGLHVPQGHVTSSANWVGWPSRPHRTKLCAAAGPSLATAATPQRLGRCSSPSRFEPIARVLETVQKVTRSARSRPKVEKGAKRHSAASSEYSPALRGWQAGPVAHRNRVPGSPQARPTLRVHCCIFCFAQANVSETAKQYRKMVPADDKTLLCIARTRRLRQILVPLLAAVVPDPTVPLASRKAAGGRSGLRCAVFCFGLKQIRSIAIN